MGIITDIINAIFYGLYVVIMSFVFFMERHIVSLLEAWAGVFVIALGAGAIYLIYLGIKEIYKAF